MKLAGLCKILGLWRARYAILASACASANPCTLELIEKMAEDVVFIEIEFDTQSKCKEVYSIFHQLRAARRDEAEWPEAEELLQRLAAISDEAKELLSIALEGSNEEKAWIFQEISPNSKNEFELQWAFLPSEGAWIDTLDPIHLFEPDDFPYKNRKKMHLSWMWNRCNLITAALMVKLFRALGAVKVESSVAYEN